jgi:O-antigen ligase
MAQIVALVLVIAICVQFGRLLVRTLPGAGKSIVFVGVLAIVLALIALAQAIHLDQPLNRWQEQSGHVFADARWQAFRAAVTLLPDAGLFGFGPGAFRVVFPSYNLQSTIHALGTWRFLHDDYLQTLLEWGWLGSVLWALVFFGGMTVAIRSFDKHARRDWTPRRRVVLPLVIIALAGVALHALVDFPLQIESLQLYVATYLGVCWGSTLWNDRTVSHESAGIRRQKSSLEHKAR